VIPKWKDIARKCKGEDWMLDVKIAFGQYEIMINLNDIKCALKGSDATNNVMNIFFHHILKGVLGDPWNTPMQLMNTIWVVDVKQWLERIGEFMERLDWKMVKGKSHHIFPFMYNAMHK